MHLDIEYWGRLTPNCDEWYLGVDSSGRIYAFSEPPDSDDDEWIGSDFRYMGEIGQGPGDSFDIEENDAGDEIVTDWDEDYFYIAEEDDPEIREYGALQDSWYERHRIASYSAVKLIDDHPSSAVFPKIVKKGVWPKKFELSQCRTSRMGIVPISSPGSRAVPYFLIERDLTTERQRELQAAARSVAQAA